MARNLPPTNTEERNPTAAEVQASNATAEAARAQQQQGASVQVLDATPIRTVDMSPPGNRIDALPDMVSRHLVDASTTAPIVRSALDVPLPKVAKTGMPVVMQGMSGGEAAEAAPPVERKYRVMETRMILDTTSASRTKLQEGKEISDKHYLIRRLQQQGVKLKDITNLDPNAPV
jgi:hypothetical protein